MAMGKRDLASKIWPVSYTHLIFFIYYRNRCRSGQTGYRYAFLQSSSGNETDRGNPGSNNSG